MAITPDQILLYYPEQTDGDLWGGRSTPQTIPQSKNAIFDDVTGDEAATGDTEYRKVFVGIDSSAGSQALSNVYVWISVETPGDDTLFLKTRHPTDDVNYYSDIPAYTGNGYPTAAWKHCTNRDDGIFLGTITTHSPKGIWICRWVPPECSAYANNSAVLRIEGETA